MICARVNRCTRFAAIVALAVAGATTGACKKIEQGRRLASGLARDIVVSPSGSAVSFLQGAVHPDDRGVPEDLFVGDLFFAWVAGNGSAERIGGGVPTLAGARAFSPGGEWLAYLAQWRFRDGEGELWLAEAAAPPRKVADAVSSMRWAPMGSLLAFVASGKLMVLDAAKEPAAPSVALDGVQTFAWAPGSNRLAARGAAAAGGRVEMVDVGSGRLREVAKGSSDFGFGDDGALYVLGPPGPSGGDRPLAVVDAFDARPREIGRATSFAASGRDVALLSTAKAPGEAFGTLSRISRSGGAPQQLGERVSDYRFSLRGDILFLARYDTRARAGMLTIAPRAKPPREIAARVQSFTVQRDRILYVAHAPQKGDFRIELWTAPLDGSSPPRKVDDGVYGYQLSPDGKSLFWKARCAGGSRSCSLFQGAADGSSPRLIATNVAGFDLSADGSRVLVQQPHRGAPRAVDLAVVATDGPRGDASAEPFATEVEPSSRFVDARGRRVVYAAMSAARAGVYLVDVP